MKKLNLILLVISIMLFYSINSEVVCSEDELIKELLEDIADNGRLDCLRESYPKPNETVNEKRLRELANWSGDCAFESNGSWIKPLLSNYPLTIGILDVDGNPVQGNQIEQADMCEIIRTFIGNNMIDGINLDSQSLLSLSKTIIEYIDCPQGICAATQSSYLDENGWYIFLDGQSVRFNDYPEYEVVGN